MLNVHSIFKETIKAIGNNVLLMEKVGKEGVGKIKADLVVETDNILHNILINLADSYPQAPASGGTPRMREAINEVNRVDDEENDLIHTCGIKISDFLSIESQDNLTNEKIIFDESEDYTDFIMKVINAAIDVTQDNSDDSRERTIFEKFKEFN